ncbi:MAG: PD-(D/E)XK nuclease family protein, partial [Paludibacteraceae bacterium]|nr:PD-(D/E)XK nuclease family protein [Paludibacteraceae bacterium]
ANLDEYYQTGTHEGGYVRFRAYHQNSADARVREEMVRAMFVEMEKLLASGVESKDCLILIRKNADARLLIRLFREMQQDKTSFPRLSRSEIVSGDSFALDGSRAVNVVINGLKYVLRRDKIARAYIELCCPEADWQALENVRDNLPLTEMLTEVMRLSLCPNGPYKGEDILYLNSLQDRVREYVGKYGANVEQFLAYWDDSLHKKSVGAAENNAIRLMTIHKAKGLEAKNVFVPFCNWEMVKTGKDFLWCEPAMQPEDESQRLSLVPILNRQDMAKAGYKSQFDAECDEQLVDNLNLLYVALTRAAERLYISAELGKDAADPEKMADNVGSLLLHACDLAEPFEKIGEGEFVEYETGDVKVTGSNLAELGRSAKPCPGLQVTDDKPLPQPFSFRDAEEVKATFCLEPARVEFRQSQDSFQYTMYGTEQGQQNLDKRAFGTICHDILAQADRQEDVAQAVNRFVQQGIIRDEQIRGDVESTLAKAWQHEKMRDWFSGRYELLREETILLPERLRKQFTAEERALDKAAEEVTEQRPDRVMTLGDRAIVLDYKFGAMNERVYFPQVRRYMLLMRELGYAQVEGYIWAAETNELIEVTA